jgi:putative ABC transport system permease protein
LGAKPIDIIELVLLESVFTTAISGVGGLLIASGIMGVLGPLLDSPGFRDPSVDTNIMVIVTIILIVSGIVAGLLPSIKAARIKPIEALSSN